MGDGDGDIDSPFETEGCYADKNNWIPTDTRTDGQTDTPSKRDARTNIKVVFYSRFAISISFVFQDETPDIYHLE